MFCQQKSGSYTIKYLLSWELNLPTHPKVKFLQTTEEVSGSPELLLLSADLIKHILLFGPCRTQLTSRPSPALARPGMLGEPGALGE